MSKQGMQVNTNLWLDFIMVFTLIFETKEYRGSQINLLFLSISHSTIKFVKESDH